MPKKNSQYYSSLMEMAARIFPDIEMEDKRKYAQAIIETIREFDLNFDLHVKYLKENRFANDNYTLFFPSLTHILGSPDYNREEANLLKSKTVPVHIEYFGPVKRVINTDEPLMHLLTIEQYLKYMVNEFCLIADFSINNHLEHDFFEALVSQYGFCFETAIRSIRAWYNTQQGLKKEFKDQDEAFFELVRDMEKCKLNDDMVEVAMPGKALLAYYMSTRAPRVGQKPLSFDEIQALAERNKLK